ncbi:MAG: Ig-like domain repeat protein [Akkermansiaceae bacterium]|nr:Ig-like domain repeat protein [Akkermansiaceae bacterium]
MSAVTGPAAAPATFAWKDPVAGHWSDHVKWTHGQSNGVAPAAGGQLDYALGFSQSGTYAVTNDLNAGFLLNKLVFGGATLTLEGNSLAFGANGTALPQIIHNGGSGVTIKAPINLSANLTNAFLLNGAKVVTGNSFSANLNGPVVLAATSTFDLTTTGNMNISGVISGPGGLTKEGPAGPLQIFGTDTFAGPVTVNAGSLRVTSFNSVSGGTPSSCLGAPTTVANGTISLGAHNAPGTLMYSGPGETTDRVIRLAGTIGGVTINQAGTAGGLPTTRGVSGLLKFTGNIVAPGIAGQDNRKTLTLTHTMSSKTGRHVGQGEISGGIGDSVLGTLGQLATSVTKDGSGTWTLSGANTYTGTTRVMAGTLAFTSAESLGTGDLDITTGAKVQLDFIGTRQVAALTFNAGTAQANGTYGSSLSLATNKDDVHFAGLGTVTVGPIAAPTTTTLARTGGTSPCIAGVAVTFTAAVAGTAPTGNVIFYDGLKVIGTSLLNGSYQASVTTSTLAAASHAITALYVGNAANAPGASAALPQILNETRAATTTALGSGANPSNSGAPVTFTATVTGKAPTGSVTFYDGTSELGRAAINGTKASFSTRSLAAGWHCLSACYAGDPTNRPSASAPGWFQTVNPPAGNGKLKVFILAGQSNMVGKGSVENGRDPNNPTGPAVGGGLGSLRHMLNANPQKYGYLADPAHPIAGGSPGWITRPDVWITYYGGASWELSEKKALRSGNLDAEFGENAKDGLIGPEYGFGLVVGSRLADQVLIIKYAHGGRSLGADFRPPSSGGTVGPCYTEMIGSVHQVLDHIAAEFPAYTGGGYELVGFGWHQGWNDRISPPFVAEYETNMVNLIKDLRAEFHAPNMRVAIANTGMANADSDVNASHLITAQANVADPARHPEWVGTVTTVDTRPFDYGELMGVNEQGFHWYFNGESYFNIGESMGVAMMGMLQPSPEGSLPNISPEIRTP